MTEKLQLSGGPNRRSFMRGLITMLTGGLALIGPLIGGLAVLIDPLRRKGTQAGSGFVKVGPLASLPKNGLPKKFDILSDKQDAWNKYLNVPVGSVYLRRNADDVVTAFNIICPHAGCFVQIDSKKTQFNCPCHDSQFKLDGSKANPDNPSPRGMDALEVEVRDKDIWVRYQNFKTGVSDRIPTS